VGRVWGGQRTVAVIDVIDTGRRGGFDPEVVDATTFPIAIADEAATGASTMSAWSTDALRTMAATDDLHISPCRGGGNTYGTATWMWSVAVDDARGARVQRQALSLVSGRAAAKGGAGHCRRDNAGRVVRTGQRSDQRPHRRRGPGEDTGSPSLSPMIGARARAATVKAIARDGNA
jgi:hypothetical protein